MSYVYPGVTFPKEGTNHIQLNVLIQHIGDWENS